MHVVSSFLLYVLRNLKDCFCSFFMFYYPHLFSGLPVLLYLRMLSEKQSFNHNFLLLIIFINFHRNFISSAAVVNELRAYRNIKEFIIMHMGISRGLMVFIGLWGYQGGLMVYLDMLKYQEV